MIDQGNTGKPDDDNTETELDWLKGLNSKQLELLSPKVLLLEQFVVDEKPEPFIIWGLKKEPVVGEGSACKINKQV